MSLGFTSVGKRKIAVHVALYCVNIIVLALSARVNLFQEFFFVADLFPLGLSIVTLVILTVISISTIIALPRLALDFACKNSYTGRPQFEIGVFAVLSIFWLSFNAFSTSRWRHVPMSCPAGADAVKTWCQDVQALKAFVWIEWLIFSLTAYMTLRYTISQKSRGNKHILRMPLSRYSPFLKNDGTTDYIRNSEFLTFSESKL